MNPSLTGLLISVGVAASYLIGYLRGLHADRQITAETRSRRSSPENVEDFITDDGRIRLGAGKSIAPEDFARYVRYVYGPTTIKESQP